jgi:hypothetical protein
MQQKKLHDPRALSICKRATLAACSHKQTRAQSSKKRSIAERRPRQLDTLSDQYLNAAVDEGPHVAQLILHRTLPADDAIKAQTTPTTRHCGSRADRPSLRQQKMLFGAKKTSDRRCT